METRKKIKLTYREFFSWYFGVATGHPFDDQIYRHGTAHQYCKEGMNFTNSLDAFKYECETQDVFFDASNPNVMSSLPIEVCVNEIFPVLDSDTEVDIDIIGDEYCFILPSGRRLEQCCAQSDYNPDWREHIKAPGNMEV